MRTAFAAMAVVGLAGCGSNLPGHYWALTATGKADTCHPSIVSHEPTELEYRVVYDGNDVTLAIGPDEFAWGIANGCLLQYETIVWTEEDADGARTSWKMQGSATVKRGEDGCAVPGGDGDWSGTETFTIVYSDDPTLAAGCTYTDELTGTYEEEIAGKDSGTAGGTTP